MSQFNTVSIVIPALNEELGIGDTIDEIPIEAIRKMGFDVEVLVVDGSSIDGTRKIAESRGTNIVLEESRGYGRAFKTGFEKSVGDIIVTLDADSSYPAAEIPKIVGLLISKDLDFITTNRLHSLEKDAMNTWNYIGNRILTLVTRLLFSNKIRDSQSGMWIFRRRILNDLMLESNGMEFSEEIKIKAFDRFRASEIPIKYRKRRGVSKINCVSDGLRNLLFLFKLRLYLHKKPEGEATKRPGEEDW